MIPNETPQSIETTGNDVVVVGKFTNTEATQARILMSLSDKMYTRKALAVVREYCNNAADAHIVAGKPISEVVVSFPTYTDMTFKVRDFGSGLTQDQIVNVYCIFGESTKRNSNDQNGVLGYGCKCGFAVADSFTVTSWINGVKTVYNCVKGDVTKLHSVLRLCQLPSDDPSGIEVSIPISSNDMYTVHAEAYNLFKYWKELPTLVNLNETYSDEMKKFRDTAPTLNGDGWEVRPKTGGYSEGVAFMGGVPYRLNWSVLYTRMALTSQRRVLFDVMQSNNVILYFKMGEVQFVDNREELEYTEFTLKAIISKLEVIFDTIKDSFQHTFDKAHNLWEAKVLYNSIFRGSALDVENGESPSAVESVKVLEGNMKQLESVFKDIFTWRGIVLGNCTFDKINRFDNESPDRMHDGCHSPMSPVMITYRKKKSRSRIRRCTSSDHNHIIAHNSVAVVLNDIGNKTSNSVVSRYLMFQYKFITVHILSFSNDTIKSLFYNQYNFDTVPIIKMSDVLPSAKEWNRSHAAPRSYRQSSGGGSGVRKMRYIDVNSLDVIESDVAVRDIEEGGMFLELSSISKSNNLSFKVENLMVGVREDVIVSIKTLVDNMELGVDRVYLINKQTRESKWFNEAIDSGDWTNFVEEVKDNFSSLDVDNVRRISAYMTNFFICSRVANSLSTKIKEYNSLMRKALECLQCEDYVKNVKTIKALKNLELWSSFTFVYPVDEYKKLYRQTNEYYPLLKLMVNHLNGSDILGPTDMASVVNYINAMDVYVNVCDSQQTEVLV